MMDHTERRIPRKILVTGGAGFIGSHTVDLLLKSNREVIVLDNLFSGKLTNLPLQDPNLEFIEGDVLEYPLLVDLIANCDAVLHLAAVTSVPMSIADPVYSFQVNTQGFLHVLQAIRNSKRKVRLVFASSAAVYGESADLPCRDDMPLSRYVLSPYALQKMHCEDYAESYGRCFDVPSLGLRYFNVYGDRQDPSSPYSGVITRFLNAYRHDHELTIYGSGEQSRDYVQVSEIARANLQALDANYTGVVNIGTGIPQTLLQLIEHIEAIGKKPAKKVFEANRVGDIQASYAATELALQQLDFAAKVSLKEGIASLLNKPAETASF